MPSPSPPLPSNGQGAVTYQLVTEPTSWVNARDHCRSLGLDLASMHSLQDVAAAQTVAVASFDGDYYPADGQFEHWWIGFNDIGSEGYWEWSDGTSNSWDYWNYAE